MSSYLSIRSLVVLVAAMLFCEAGRADQRRPNIDAPMPTTNDPAKTKPTGKKAGKNR